jgi:hypothetical protein
MTFVFGNLRIFFEYPPPPKVQSIKTPPLSGEHILITSSNITEKWDIFGGKVGVIITIKFFH